MIDPSSTPIFLLISAVSYLLPPLTSRGRGVAQPASLSSGGVAGGAGVPEERCLAQTRGGGRWPEAQPPSRNNMERFDSSELLSTSILSSNFFPF